MYQDTPRDAASVLFDLPGYRVIDARDTADGRRWVLAEPTDPVGHCPDCGFDSARVHARPQSRLADVPVAGAIEVWIRKRRLVCGNDTCDKATFVQTTDQVGFRARVTTRLAGQVVDALVCEARSVSAIADQLGVSWPTVMGLAKATVEAVHDVDSTPVARLGVDEHRFRRVRYVKTAQGSTVKVDPWSVVLTDLDTSQVLDVVSGRRGAAVKAWIRARPQPWRDAVQIVAMDMSAEFRAAIRTVLPGALITADHWHVAARANRMIDGVRRRRSWDLNQRRGRVVDPAWRYRKLLVCAAGRLSQAQRHRLGELLAADGELAAAWAVKEFTRDLLATTTPAGFDTAWDRLDTAVALTTTPEPHALMKTLKAWKAEIRTFCLTRVSNAKTEAANLTAKNIKRAGRGYVNHDNYRTRILLSTTARKAA